MTFQTKSSTRSFGGRLLKLTHNSSSTKGEMTLNLYLPPQASSSHKVPVLFYLAGLTCTGDNCAEKGFFQSAASEKDIAVVYPDTSPRGCNIEGEDKDWDFGSGASFYLDALLPPYAENYRMSTYITSELPTALFSSFSELDGHRMSICGHSMGGHGALTLYLKNPGLYKSVSAFAPIANPSKCPWGEKAFKGYLGEDDKGEKEWAKHDATELVKGWEWGLDVLIDQGTGDDFNKQGQLLPENFVEAAKSVGKGDGVKLRMQEGYNHSYFFISTFATDHVNHAAKYLFA